MRGLHIHGLNPKRIGTELSWEYEEEYIAELLLINAIAIFDTWVDEFVDSTLLKQSNEKKKEIKADVKKGEFIKFDNLLAQEDKSSLAGCFHFTKKRQDRYIGNLILVYNYFKTCRNCCAHGNGKFNHATETNYNNIVHFTKEDCGVNEFPQIAVTKSGEPLKLILRGVVGFYDVLIRIINHYDLVAAEKKGVEKELIKRWRKIPSVTLSSVEKKRNQSIQNYMKSVNMCPPYETKTNDIYRFLKAKHVIK